MATPGCWTEPMGHGRPASSGPVSNMTAHNPYLRSRNLLKEDLGLRDRGELALPRCASHDKRIEALDGVL